MSEPTFAIAFREICSFISCNELDNLADLRDGSEFDAVHRL